MESDALRGIRNSFYLGAYEQARDESSELRSDSHPEIANYANIYYYRSLAHINPQQCIAQIKKTDSTALRTVQQYALYLTQPAQSQQIIAELSQWLGDDSSTTTDLTLQIILALIHLQEKNYKDALKLVVENDSTTSRRNLEKSLIAIEIYLLLNRLDLAEKLVKQMADVDEDDTLTQLGSAYYGNYQGDKASVLDAANQYQELIDKFGPSVKALNGLALSQLQQGDYTTALNNLKDAKKLAEDQNLPTQQKKPNAETLINSAISFRYLQKPQIYGQIETELRSHYSQHQWFTRQDELNDAFTRAAANYSVKA